MLKREDWKNDDDWEKMKKTDDKWSGKISKEKELDH